MKSNPKEPEITKVMGRYPEIWNEFFLFFSQKICDFYALSRSSAVLRPSCSRSGTVPTLRRSIGAPILAMNTAFDAIPAFMLILVSFPLFAVAIVKIVGMMLEQSIETVPGFLALGIVLAMFGGMCISKSPVIPWAILLVLATMLAFYPFAARQICALDHRRINKDAIERAYQAWAARPDNAAAALLLAKALYQHGYRAAGMKLAETTLAGVSTEMDPFTMRSPRDFFRMEELELKKWQRESTPDQFRPISCPHCSAQNDPALLECPQCGRPSILEAVRAGDSLGRMAGKLVLGWALIAGAIVGTVAAATSLKGILALLAMATGLAAVGGLLAWLFRQPKFDGTLYRPIVED